MSTSGKGYCAFPFTYEGVVYKSCTTKNHNRPWCSITVNYDKDMKRGDCSGRNIMIMTFLALPHHRLIVGSSSAHLRLVVGSSSAHRRLIIGLSLAYLLTLLYHFSVHRLQAIWCKDQPWWLLCLSLHFLWYFLLQLYNQGFFSSMVLDNSELQ